MEDFRSRSYAYGEGRMQMELYGSREGPFPPPPTGLHDLRCYSASYSHPPPKELKLKKGKGDYGSSSSSSSKSGWSLGDPEFQRKKRVASYKVYAAEGKVKGSLRKSFRWIKDRYTQVVYGWS